VKKSDALLPSAVNSYYSHAVERGQG